MINYSEISIIYIPLLIFCVWGNNIMTPNLMNSQLETQFNNSKLLQHIYNFTLMYVIFTSLVKRKSTFSFVITLLAYLWFLLINEVDVNNRVIIFCLLALGYMYNHKMEKKNIELSGINKYLGIENRKNIIKVNNIIMFSILIFTIYCASINKFK